MKQTSGYPFESKQSCGICDKASDLFSCSARSEGGVGFDEYSVIEIPLVLGVEGATDPLGSAAMVLSAGIELRESNQIQVQREKDCDNRRSCHNLSQTVSQV